jgi:hypothetical protein
MKIQCANPACAVELDWNDDLAGKEIECPTCNQVFCTPATAAAPAFSARSRAIPPAAAPVPPMTTSTDRREALNKVIQLLIVVAAVVILQYVVDLLPGMDAMLVRRVALGDWIKAGLAVVTLVVMLQLLKPLKVVTSYYVGLMFRVSSSLGSDEGLTRQVSNAGLYLILILYVAFLYQIVLPPMLNSLTTILGFGLGFQELIRLAFAVVVIVLVVRLMLSLKPLLNWLTDKIATRTAELTEKVETKVCPECETRMDRMAKFCSSCGKCLNFAVSSQDVLQAKRQMDADD